MAKKALVPPFWIMVAKGNISTTFVAKVPGGVVMRVIVYSSYDMQQTASVSAVFIPKAKITDFKAV